MRSRRGDRSSPGPHPLNGQPPPHVFTYGYAVLVSGVLAYLLFRIPIQLTDSFVNLLALNRPFLDVMREVTVEQGFSSRGCGLH